MQTLSTPYCLLYIVCQRSFCLVLFILTFSSEASLEREKRLEYDWCSNSQNTCDCVYAHCKHNMVGVCLLSQSATEKLNQGEKTHIPLRTSWIPTRKKVEGTILLFWLLNKQTFRVFSLLDSRRTTYEEDNWLFSTRSENPITWERETLEESWSEEVYEKARLVFCYRRISVWRHCLHFASLA